MPAFLFAAAFVTTLFAGALYGASYLMGLGLRPRLLSPETFQMAFAYAGPLLAILWAHELGHMAVAKKYGVPVSGPYFIPLPVPLWGSFATGLGGAFVVTGRSMPTRRACLEYAVAGPLAGFAVTVIVLVVGFALSHAPNGAPIASNFPQPLLVQWVAGDVVFHPTLTAGWYGTWLTAINLIPLPPFDGFKILEACASGGVRLGPMRWSIVGACVLIGVLCCPPLF